MSNDKEQVRYRNPVKQLGFSQIENILTLDNELSDGAYRLYSLLLMYARQKDNCFPGIEKLGADIGKSGRAILRAMNQLVSLGLITRQKRFGTSAITWIEDIEGIEYYVKAAQARLDESDKNVTLEQMCESDKNVTTKVTKVSLRKCHNRHPNNKQISNKQNNNAVGVQSELEDSSFNPAITNLLTNVGVEHNTAKKLSEFADIEIVTAWLDYADTNSLGPGFIVSRIRTGEAPPTRRRDDRPKTLDQMDGDERAEHYESQGYTKERARQLAAEG